MEIKELEVQARRDFNNAVCLMGILPLLMFVYILAVRIASLEIFVGDIGYIVFASIIICLIGMFLGRKMLRSLIRKLIDFNYQVLSMQKELVEKNRLAAITETVLTLGHEINNPMLVIQGNLESLVNEFVESGVPPAVKNRLHEMKNHCERIMLVTQKLSNLSKPVLAPVHSDTSMIDLTKSE